jgi:hypothetical protein
MLCVSVRLITEKAAASGCASDLYSKGAGFEFRPRQRVY